MTTKEDVEARLRSLLHEIGGIDLDKIVDSATVEDELQMSSLAFVELQVALEEHYQIQIDPIQVVELGSFRAIADYVYELASVVAAA